MHPPSLISIIDLTLLLYRLSIKILILKNYHSTMTAIFYFTLSIPKTFYRATGTLNQKLVTVLVLWLLTLRARPGFQGYQSASVTYSRYIWYLLMTVIQLRRNNRLPKII